MEWLTHNSTISIASAIGGAMLTHIFYKLKLKVEQKIRFQNTIGDEIVDSLREIRILINQAMVVEIYDMENKLKTENVSLNLHTSDKYPAFMNDGKYFLLFHEQIMTLRGKYADNIDQDIAVHLLYAEQYFNSLLLLAARFNDEDEMENLHLLGTIFIQDIHKNIIALDKKLIKKINNPPLKLELHTGIKWRWKKKLYEKRLWKNTILYKVINGIYDDNTKHARDILSYLEEKTYT